MKYKELKNYKYQLAENYSIQTELKPVNAIFEPNKEKPFIELDTNGVLTIFSGYSWDGASGIAIDTNNFIRGSLVHDAFYQLMRKRKLSLAHRDYADRLLQKICKEDGMSSFRANNVYYAVKIFGESSAAPTSKKEIQETILEAP
ncbi:MAG TPA: DUF1353 domain-containing protein [Leptospiraceae bacterium]|nr:DUF1353 domain-containing protein [Leptospiraceae bacterium]HMW03979.1 DUF1353 domain-containing protein [Leptospiraceae bacterium]HMX35323.1 DUF1353 domain-containing protein [Leptospiraceae bacterium]HMY29959.1 DUF1353 domain-containing protein [Leptospiraceae bacterium]HMZ66764.1 DUF1353 domain-containing protein [Leptospiraceae bacterium]